MTSLNEIDDITTKSEIAISGNNQLSISQMSQEYWNQQVTAAAKAASGNNSEQRSQFFKSLELSLQNYNYGVLVVALETWGGGYRSQWGWTIPTENIKEYALRDGNHYYEAWVIGC